MVEVTVSRLGLDQGSNSHVVILQERHGARFLPIWIGQPEAEAIAAQLNGIKRERPMTHDLVRSLVVALGGVLRRVQITRVQSGTYYAELHVLRQDQLVTVDARPSDSIAIALRLNAPIYVQDQLLTDPDGDAATDAPPADPDPGPPPEDPADQLKTYLQGLRPEDFGKFTLGVFCAVALALSALVSAVSAQRPSGVRVHGHVVISRAAGPVPAVGTWVVLHRVAPGAAGPVDSVRAGPDGDFTFANAIAPNDSAFVFVSASHHGIAYFSTPTRGASAGAREAEIVAFDTASTGPPIVSRGRHIVVQRAGGDRRTVLEVHDLENTGPTTRVGAGDAPTATLPLPAAAEAPRADQGDVSAEAMRFRDDVAEVLAPLAPGLKQASVRYGVPVGAFPLTLRVRDRTGVVEVVLEDSTAAASGAAFGAREVVTIEGRRFWRMTAQDVPAGSTITIAGVPGGGVATWQVAALAVLVAALIGVGAAAQRRRIPAVSGPALATVGLSGLSAARGSEAEQLARRIAALDQAFRAQPSPDAAARAAYEAERTALKDALTQRLAGDAPGR